MKNHLGAIAYAPGTAGEIIQGYDNGKPFLVTCPISLYSVAEATTSTRYDHLVTQEGYQKVEQALRELKSLRDLATHFQVTIHSELPRGKGLASSSSEIAAALGSVSALLRLNLSSEEYAAIAVHVEPTDTIFSPGIVKCDPLSGQITQHFGGPPPMGVLLVDGGGTVSSHNFDRQYAQEKLSGYERQYRDALRLLEAGFQSQSAFEIAQAATLSAELNQKVLHKPLFEPLRRLTEQSEASAEVLGVGCAHTGTLLSVYFEPRNTHLPTLYRRVAQIVGAERILGHYELVSGGVHTQTFCFTEKTREAQRTLASFAIGNTAQGFRLSGEGRPKAQSC